MIESGCAALNPERPPRGIRQLRSGPVRICSTDRYANTAADGNEEKTESVQQSATAADLPGWRANELRTHQIERRLAVPGDEKFPLTGVQCRNRGLELIVGHRIGGIADGSRPVLHAPRVATVSSGVRTAHQQKRRWSPAGAPGTLLRPVRESLTCRGTRVIAAVNVAEGRIGHQTGEASATGPRMSSRSQSSTGTRSVRRAGRGYVSGLSALTSIIAMPVSSSMSLTVNMNVPRALTFTRSPGLMVGLSPIDTTEGTCRFPSSPTI